MHRYLMLALACCLCFTVSAHAQPQKANGELKIEIIKLFNDPAVTAFVANNGDDPVALNWYANILKLAETPDARFFMAADTLLNVMNNGQQLIEGLFENKEFNMDTPRNFIELDEYSGGTLGYGYNIKSYTTADTNDGSVWGLLIDGQYTKYSWFEKDRIYRFYQGVLYDITPAYPQEADFYTDGLPEYPADPYAERQFIYEEGLDKCKMYVTFAVDTQTAPYKIKAVLKQENDAGYAPYFQPAYECTPQCVIEYVWDGIGYARGEKICRADGGWGVTVPAIPDEEDAY